MVIICINAINLVIISKKLPIFCSTDESKKYVNMFSGMERLPQLVKYYSRCEKGSMCREWTNLVELDQDHGVIEWLQAFYHSLLTNWQSQVTLLF